jgi:hypothetical protein
VSRRRTILLAAALVVLAAFAAVAAHTRSSSATFTTGSQSTVTASVDSVTNWVHLYSETSDPDGLTGYARQANAPGGALIASGSDKSLVLDLGSYPDLNKTFAFSRVLTLKTPPSFPLAGVNQVTVSVSLVADPGGTQPLRNPALHLTTQGGTGTSVTLGANAKAQLDISLRTKKNPWDAGDQFRPHIVLSMTYPGGPAGAYAYDLTALLTII